MYGCKNCDGNETAADCGKCECLKCNIRKTQGCDGTVCKKEQPNVRVGIRDNISHFLDVHPMASNHIILSVLCNAASRLGIAVDVTSNPGPTDELRIRTEDGTELLIEKFGRVTLISGTINRANGEVIRG